MDITKRFDRILKIFFLLQSKAVVSLEEIKERFGISERTIFRDLKALEAAGVPVFNEAGSGYSIMEGFRLQPTRFTEEEMLSLAVAEKMMLQHETQFIKQHFDAALIKIKGSLRYQQKDALLQLEGKLHFTENTKSAGYLPNVLDVLLNSILKKKVATIYYLKSGEDATTARKVEPVGVYHERQNWYLMAWCHLRNEYRNFRLDRVKKIELLETDFSRQHPPLQTLRATEQEPEKAQTITIKIARQHARNLYWERDHFGFEKEEYSGDEVLMHFRFAYDTCYFVRWFLMFADMGQIIAPVQLQQEVLALAQVVLDRNRKSAV
jgi:predicted DNA-binding transcriptional regulator YafY